VRKASRNFPRKLSVFQESGKKPKSGYVPFRKVIYDLTGFWGFGCGGGTAERALLLERTSTPQDGCRSPTGPRILLPKSQKKSVQITHFRGCVRCNRSVAFASQEIREMFLYCASMLIKEVTKSSITYSNLSCSTPAHTSWHFMCTMNSLMSQPSDTWRRGECLIAELQIFNDILARCSRPRAGANFSFFFSMRLAWRGKGTRS